MIGLLTIFHKPKGGNLLIAYSSLAEDRTEDGNIYKGVEFTPYLHLPSLYYLKIENLIDCEPSVERLNSVLG